MLHADVLSTCNRFLLWCSGLNLVTSVRRMSGNLFSEPSREQESLPMGRLLATDDSDQMCVKLFDGNPGALAVLAQLVSASPRIDPDAEPLAALWGLDAEEIYGEDIFVLFNVICSRNMVNMVAVLRARQLALLKPGVLIAAVNAAVVDEEAPSVLNVDGVLQQVKELLPSFGRSIR